MLVATETTRKVMNKEIAQSLSLLTNYVEEENFKGWDPFDGLNSTFFKSLPGIRSSKFFRLAWIQFFKRSPVNFRKIAGIGKEYNNKGLALFLTGYCRLYSISKDKSYLEKIKEITDLLIQRRSEGYKNFCWGYNFDWQSRAFFQPKNTPTIVVSVYVTSALLEAFEITQDQRILDVAKSCADFVLHDLNRSYDADGDFCFSYSPRDSTRVYNASLLGSRLLSKMYQLTGNEHYKEEAKKSVRYCVKAQQSNGAWAYGELPFHQWIDNFHTGFNLECLAEYQKNTGDTSFSQAIEAGFKYYVETFFEADGKAKYYSNRTYPIDIHAPAQLVATLYALGNFKQQQELCDRVLLWTIKNMQDKKGFFYYQAYKNFSSKIPYMRWSQSWMFYALCTYKKVFTENSKS